MELVDTHCHLDEGAFAHDSEAVIAAAVAAGVTRMLTVGTTAASCRAAVELAETFANVWAVVGIQPNYTAAAQPDDWGVIEQLAAHPRVVAIGETGLDRYWDYAPLDVQRNYFDRHMDLAVRIGKPYVVHCREAEADVVEQMRHFAGGRQLRGVMHSFSGDQATAAACLELGLHLSFAGMVTFKKSEALRAVAATAPLERVLVETDAPYLAPTPYRGKRNEPAWVRLTAECIAAARGMALEDFARATTHNACALFQLPSAAPAAGSR